MSNILFNQATFHAIGQDPFLAYPVSIKLRFLGIEILEMSQSWLFFCATYTEIAESGSQIDDLWPEKTNIESTPACRALPTYAKVTIYF